MTESTKYKPQNNKMPKENCAKITHRQYWFSNPSVKIFCPPYMVLPIYRTPYSKKNCRFWIFKMFLRVKNHAVCNFFLSSSSNFKINPNDFRYHGVDLKTIKIVKIMLKICLRASFYMPPSHIWNSTSSGFFDNIFSETEQHFKKNWKTQTGFFCVTLSILQMIAYSSNISSMLKIYSPFGKPPPGNNFSPW